MKAGIQSTLWSIAATVCLLACTKNGSSETPVTIPPVTPPKDTIPSLANVRSWLVDKAATAETAALFYNLKKVAKTGILFGHQDATKRGVIDAATQWANEQHLPAVSRDRSDVKEVTGAYPAVYGHDFLHIANFNKSPWFQYEASIARQLTIDAYNRGGVNTFAWHYNNPVSKGSFYWNESKVAAVANILPGGSHNDVFKQSLKEIADFATSLLGADGKLVPVIFRPFHEFDGDWFWWGKAHCTADQYKQLYQFTVTYLRDSLGVRNFLYAWSPDKNFNTELQYLERYPGDAYVDLVGMDNYGDMAVGTAPSVAGAKLKIISDYAIRKNKVAALTETGLSRLLQSDWFTGLLQKALQSSTPQLAYVLVWANTKDHFWTPYKGHPAEADFIKFKQSPYVHFGDEMPKMYEIK
ncbi:glycoside hydrolase family 26 protein [Paracnuella aquatica]|uniref:glycoside hydrolase family 26 protein n=1 Tax=Paracnuella aquatica TaxID=2268757 RepID=UPI000DEF0DE4|nr:glycosyl hydrolase [Paracnuella aquatica]RPD43999.1 beta-mannosidase [Paracnuella aquatica]